MHGSYVADNGDTIISNGDRLRGLFDIQTIEDLASGGPGQACWYGWGKSIYRCF